MSGRHADEDGTPEPVDVDQDGEDDAQPERGISSVSEGGGGRLSRFRLGRRASTTDEAAPPPAPPARPSEREPGGDRGDVQGERGISPVAGRLGRNNAGRALGAVSLAVVAAMLMFVTLDQGEGKEADPAAEDRQTPAKQVVSFEPAAPPPPAPSEPPVAGGSPGLDAPGLLGASGERQQVPAVEPAGYGPSLPRQQFAERSPALRENPSASLLDSARRAPVLAFTQKRTGGGQAPGSYAQALLGQAAGSPTEPNERDELARLTRGSTIGEVRAQRLPDRNYLVTAGTVLPCILQTALDSSTPGYATCLIPRNVYSDNGNVVLMEKGTKVIGEYRDGLKRGQKRLFVLWTRAVTPEGVAIDLGAPASDAQGRSGFDGRVENFFWQRFGGALLLSIVDDAVFVAADGGGSQNVTRLPSDAAAIALENSISIAPVLRKNQGEEVGIFVNKDLNFADVYGLRPRAAR